MSEHEHDWHTTSNLRLVISQPDMEVFASIVPTALKLMPVEYCCGCGAVRLPPDIVTAITLAEQATKREDTE